MAQPATNPKIEELRFRLKTDPKSRLFYQLAEELRRAGQFAEAEQVLRTGIVVYPTYLAAWVSLGRVLREQKNEEGAVEALNTALQLDPGNVVAARLLADAYLSLGQKIEAIKKYKLVHAILPSDEELRGTIERLERELQPPPVSAPDPEPEPEAQAFAEPEPFGAPEPEPQPEAFAEPERELAPVIPMPLDVIPDVSPMEDSPFDKTTPPFALDDDRGGYGDDGGTGDAEPMPLAHDESPFEEPAEGYSAASLEIEAPLGMHVDVAPLAAEVPAPLPYEEEEADVFAPDAPAAVPPPQELTDTLTMADLYARQGLVDDAKQIYEHILARDPENAGVRSKLAALMPAVTPAVTPAAEPPAALTSGDDGEAKPVAPPAPVQAKVERLEQWLAKVSRKEVGSV